MQRGLLELVLWQDLAHPLTSNLAKAYYAHQVRLPTLLLAVPVHPRRQLRLRVAPLTASVRWLRG